MGRGEKSSKVQISCADFIEVFSFQEEKKNGVQALQVPEHTRSGPSGLCSRSESSRALSRAAELPGSPQLGQAAEAEPLSRPRAATSPLQAGARSCLAAFHQGSISVLFSGGEMILSR